MLEKFFTRYNITSIKLIISTALFWVIFANFSFFSALLHVYPLNLNNALFLASLVFAFTSLIVIFLLLLCFRRTIKTILIVLLITTSLAAYFMDTYNIIIDESMLRNAFETDAAETRDLISVNMLMYILLLGILPSIFVYRLNIIFKPVRQEIFVRVKLMVSLVVIILILLFSQSAATASFFREHKAVRYHSNPIEYIYSIGKYVRNLGRSGQSDQIIVIGKDAKIPASDLKRDLVIMVVGEAARADRFSLNGYQEKTNPLLEKQNVVSFSDVRSCGTSTAISVPCMFSGDAEKNFNVDKAKLKENVLDILKRAGVQVLWRDNNSSSKGVADRVTYQNYRTSKTNTICDEECRDEGMLVGLQDFVNKQPKGDIVIILHQMGNHGPAYYKRYPKEFEKFKPVCQTNELAECSKEQINNAYDNAILYTDYFLNKVIELLKANDGKFEVSMLYVSDHGESLGENNVYLHGLPNYIAPKTQRHVPMIMWVGKHYDGVNIDQLRAKKDKPLSHDNIFHTLLGLLEIESKFYNKDLDFTKN